jgi:hypothetical protein
VQAALTNLERGYATHILSIKSPFLSTSGVKISAFWCSTGGVNEDKTLYNNLYQHQSKALVESILDGSHTGKTVLISWEHKVEVDIAHHLGIPVKGEVRYTENLQYS